MSGATLFGKLPAHGDFVARGLAAAERDALDNWLAGSLAAAQAQLGDDFATIYDQAPPWRFAARQGEGWHVGAMAPSMDAVGRRYPIVAGVQGVDDGRVAEMAERIEALLYAALGEGWDADRLATAIAAIEVDAGKPWSPGDRWWTLGGGADTGPAFFEDSVAGARPATLMRAVLTMREGVA